MRIRAYTCRMECLKAFSIACVLLLLSTRCSNAQAPTYYSLVIGVERIDTTKYKTTYNKVYREGLGLRTLQNVEYILKLARTNNHHCIVLMNESAGLL